MSPEKDKKVEAFVRLVLSLGVRNSRILLEFVEGTLKRKRQERHNARELRKLHAKNAKDRRAKLRRGFAVMDRARVREIASLGGQTSHVRGSAHQFSHEEAVAAGRKGGFAKAQRERVRPVRRTTG
jgi:general stress protein YciG